MRGSKPPPHPDDQALDFTVFHADGTVAVEQIAARTQLPLSQILADLTLLQIRGRIHKDHTGIRLTR